MILAMFNISGSLTMLMLDKENDIKTFKSFGVDQEEIKRIFLTKGVLTVIAGTFIGLFIGLAIAFLQQHYPFISFGVENVIVPHYPVAIRVQDIFIVIFSVLFIGILGCWYPAKILSKKLFNI
jgi:ABC-type lipoprotein release transport system permease subunit